MNKLPIILITGFLGAGKTTFLNEMLIYFKSRGSSVALLINEFGKTNIDKNLVTHDTETIYEVNQGSIFCVCTRSQFLNALDSISTHKPAFDAAIIESTGIANTRDIGTYLETPQLKDKIDIRQNFCLVDAANFHKVFETLPAVKTQVEEASVSKGSTKPFFPVLINWVPISVMLVTSPFTSAGRKEWFSRT